MGLRGCCTGFFVVSCIGRAYCQRGRGMDSFVCVKIGVGGPLGHTRDSRGQMLYFGLSRSGGPL